MVAIGFDKLSLKKTLDLSSEPFTNLQQLYEFEFTPFTKLEVNENGLYDIEAIRKHWSFSGVDVYLDLR